MGKARRIRNKLHLSSNQPKKSPAEAQSSPLELFNTPSLNFPSENPFVSLKIDVKNLSKLREDDVASVKSFKSVKSSLEATKVLSKKEKLKLKKDLLLRKIDTVNQLKKEAKLEKKRKKVAIIGDTNPMRDALPDLESLLRNCNDDDKPKQGTIKKKAIAKERKRKKTMLTHMKIYQELLKNKDFKRDPLGAISDHVKAITENNQL